MAGIVPDVEEYKLSIGFGQLNRLAVKRLPCYGAACMALNIGVFALASAVRKRCRLILARTSSITVLVADGDVAHGLHGRSSELRDTHGGEVGVIRDGEGRLRRVKMMRLVSGSVIMRSLFRDKSVKGGDEDTRR